MEHSDPRIVIEGMEEVLEKDLEKHEGILERTQGELGEYRKAKTYELKKKDHYEKLISDGKYNAGAMETAVKQIDINIRHFSDKVKLSTEKIEHHQMIVDKLAEELKTQYRNLKYLKDYKGNGLTN